MRAKLRALIIVGLSAGVFVPPLFAEKPSLLEQMGLPTMFNKGEATTTTPRAPSRNSGTFTKPGNATARNEIGPSKGSPSGTTSGSILPSFPSFKGLNDILGTGEKTVDKPVGLPADGIEAPPPPTLDPSEPTGISPATSAAKKTTQPAGTMAARPAATKTPSKDIASSPPKTEQRVASPIVQKTATIPPAATATTKKTPAKTSSRRGWQGGEPTYTAMHDGHAIENVTTESPMAPTGLIDRRPAFEGEASPDIESDDDNQSSVPKSNADLANDPPLPVIFGQEPLEGRDRLSTAARLGGAAVRVNGVGDATEQPAAEAAPPVQPASYSLPPILSAEEARKLRATRGK